MISSDSNPQPPTLGVGTHGHASEGGYTSEGGVKPTDPFSSRPKRSSLAAQGLMLAITGYQKYVSPLKGAPTCRFYPTCSSYALEAVQIHGAVKGTILATLRVLKCQPLHPGGFDPVPSLGNWKNDPRV